jgi:hypothetical protein
MTPQTINRREGGLMSFRGRSQKLAVRAGQKLLGVPTIGGGSA